MSSSAPRKQSDLCAMARRGKKGAGYAEASWLTKATLVTVRTMLAVGASVSQVAADLGISVPAVTYIDKRRRRAERRRVAAVEGNLGRASAAAGQPSDPCLAAAVSPAGET